MKHRHYDIIVALASNTELCAFFKARNGSAWRELEEFILRGGISENFDYFLCLAKHKEAVLHALGGGQSQATNEIGGGEFQDVCVGKPDVYWTSGGWYMSDACESRLKPKKEKRWIIVDPKTDYTFNFLFISKCEADKENGGEHQVVEIEVEVNG